VLDRGAQADARGDTNLLDRGIQAATRGAARCALHVHGRGAKTDACGRSFAVLSTQISTVGLRLRLVLGRSAKTDACGRSFAVLSTQVSAAGLRLRHSRLTCGRILEVSRETAAAGEEKLISCAPKRTKYCVICTVTLCPCGNVPFKSWVVGSNFATALTQA
jgi:hypothetical protein